MSPSQSPERDVIVAHPRAASAWCEWEPGCHSGVRPLGPSGRSCGRQKWFLVGRTPGSRPGRPSTSATRAARPPAGCVLFELARIDLVLFVDIPQVRRRIPVGRASGRGLPPKPRMRNRPSLAAEDPFPG